MDVLYPVKELRSISWEYPKKYPIRFVFCSLKYTVPQRFFKKIWFCRFAPLTLWRTNEHFFGIPEWQFVKSSSERILCCWQWRAVQGWAQTGPSLERCIFHMSRSKECEGSLPLCQSPTKIQVYAHYHWFTLFLFQMCQTTKQGVTKNASSVAMKQESPCLSLPTVTFKVMGRERAC